MTGRRYILDEKDLRIIRILCEDAWTPQSRIAKELGLTQQAVSLRIKKLREMGVIKRATIVVNKEAVGANIPFSLGLCVKSGFTRKVVEKLKAIPELSEIWIMSGSHRVTARGYARDISALEKVIEAIEGIEGNREGGFPDCNGNR